MNKEILEKHEKEELELIENSISTLAGAALSCQENSVTEDLNDLSIIDVLKK